MVLRRGCRPVIWRGRVSRSFVFLWIRHLRHVLSEAWTLTIPWLEEGYHLALLKVEGVGFACLALGKDLDVRCSLSDMTNPYRYHEVGHVYQHCKVCGRLFRLVKSRLHIKVILETSQMICLVAHAFGLAKSSSWGRRCPQL